MTDEAQMFLTSVGAITVLQLELELTVQMPSSSLFVMDRHIAPFFFFLPLPHALRRSSIPP